MEWPRRGVKLPVKAVAVVAPFSRRLPYQVADPTLGEAIFLGAGELHAYVSGGAYPPTPSPFRFEFLTLSSSTY
jgi:hypothetical protein